MALSHQNRPPPKKWSPGPILAAKIGLPGLILAAKIVPPLSSPLLIVMHGPNLASTIYLYF